MATAGKSSSASACAATSTRTSACRRRVARYHNVYGPLGTWTGGREKAPAAICRKVIEAKTSGKHEIEIWGDGKQTRSFMYIDDCTRGTQASWRATSTSRSTLAADELVTINQLVNIAEEIAGIKLKRNYNLDAPKGVNGRNSDNTMIQPVFGLGALDPAEGRFGQDLRLDRERDDGGIQNVIKIPLNGIYSSIMQL